MTRQANRRIRRWAAILCCLAVLAVGRAAQGGDPPPDIGPQAAIERVRQEMARRIALENEDRAKKKILPPIALDDVLDGASVSVEKHDTPDNPCLWQHQVLETGLLDQRGYEEAGYAMLDDLLMVVLVGHDYYVVILRWPPDFVSLRCFFIDAASGAILSG